MPQPGKARIHGPQLVEGAGNTFPLTVVVPEDDRAPRHQHRQHAARVAEDGSLVLAASPDRIVRLFRITGLDRAFSLYPSVPEAIAAEDAWQAAIASEGTDPDEWCRKNNLL